MLGAVRTWDVLSHPVVTVRSFGWRVFFRAVFGGQGDTFLSLLRKHDYFAASTSEEYGLVRRCAELELQAMRVYHELAERFPEHHVREFFMELASQEQEHADLLEVCWAAAGPDRWRANRFSPWHDYVPMLEAQMQAVVASLNAIGSIEDAMRLVVQIEFSEINRVFLEVLKSTDSPFVRRLAAFREAVRQHIAYICREVPKLAPGAALTCRELRAKFLQQ